MNTEQWMWNDDIDGTKEHVCYCIICIAHINLDGKFYVLAIAQRINLSGRRTVCFTWHTAKIITYSIESKNLLCLCLYTSKIWEKKYSTHEYEAKNRNKAQHTKYMSFNMKTVSQSISQSFLSELLQELNEKSIIENKKTIASCRINSCLVFV